MAATTKVYKRISRFCIGRIGQRGGVRYVEMQSGKLTLRRCKTEHDLIALGYDATDLCHKRAAAQFLNHSGGVTETARSFLMAMVDNHTDLSEDQLNENRNQL